MSIIDNAKRELDLINFGDADTSAMLDILRRFFAHWDSGGAVWAVAPILQRCIAGKPLSPLTGDSHEWIEVAEQNGGPLYQNNRCSSVFRDPLRSYDIDLPPTDGQWTAITFPYWPLGSDVKSPVVEVAGPDPAMGQ